MRELDFTTDQRCFAQSAGRIGSFEELTTVKLAGDRVADGNSLTVSPTLLKALAKLPALTTLALHAGHFDPTCHQVLLPQLRHLKFPCELCPLEVETTMSAILAPSLTSLQFYYIDAQDPPDARRYLEMFAKYYPSTLSELTIYLGMDGQGDTQLVDLLAPLHSFPVLTKLSCNLRSLVNVTFIDRDVQTLGEAWPQMSQLELLYLQRAKPALSAQCFGNFTHYFPHLQTLALSSVDLDSDLPSSKDIRTHHRLNSLTIGLILTTAEDPNLKAFANLLFTIYPRLPDLQFALITEQQAWVFVTFEREIVDS
ncbi:hypothetical protein CERSUDRAFT_112541 [Gelatoporia subvermispora B]|uniref:F-box domain-containing protein n=1 Tax=Ceriporiopsis subvermispora (strain B) TaxID=914234 RepID=M2R2N9_CERS8|nr:hypothetical protein CERSUDRAFT_112541 [Gelatoporia subvermispora B]